jgi:hypothetical protein
MRSIILIALLLFFLESTAQVADYGNDASEPADGFFKKEKLFTGGSFTFSFLNNGIAFGVNPHLGYSVTPWLDLALSINFNHIGQRDIQLPGDKIRDMIVAPGAFIRLFPVNFLFAQAQFEHNWITQRYVYPSGSPFPEDKTKLKAASFLVGLGYSGNRRPGQNSYFYFTVMYDILEDPSSPYVNNGGRAFPIFRAGVNIALFQRR